MNLKVLLSEVFCMGSVGLFLISAFVLLFIDCKEYKKNGYTREYKVSKFFGILFIFGSTGMYILMRFVVR
ncbi:MAG: CLC_0170 family protein [Clostridium sp.]